MCAGGEACCIVTLCVCPHAEFPCAMDGSTIPPGSDATSLGVCGGHDSSKIGCVLCDCSVCVYYAVPCMYWYNCT